jgi:hypothetical protein
MLHQNAHRVPANLRRAAGVLKKLSHKPGGQVSHLSGACESHELVQGVTQILYGPPRVLKLSKMLDNILDGTSYGFWHKSVHDVLLKGVSESPHEENGRHNRGFTYVKQRRPQ